LFGIGNSTEVSYLVYNVLHSSFDVQMSTMKDVGGQYQRWSI